MKKCEDLMANMFPLCTIPYLCSLSGERWSHLCWRCSEHDTSSVPSAVRISWWWLLKRRVCLHYDRLLSSCSATGWGLWSAAVSDRPRSEWSRPRPPLRSSWRSSVLVTNTSEKQLALTLKLEDKHRVPWSSVSKVQNAKMNGLIKLYLSPGDN